MHINICFCGWTTQDLLTQNIDNVSILRHLLTINPSLVPVIYFVDTTTTPTLQLHHNHTTLNFSQMWHHTTFLNVVCVRPLDEGWHLWTTIDINFFVDFSSVVTALFCFIRWSWCHCGWHWLINLQRWLCWGGYAEGKVVFFCYYVLLR